MKMKMKMYVILLGGGDLRSIFNLAIAVLCFCSSRDTVDVQHHLACRM